jgi:hypothetical protein
MMRCCWPFPVLTAATRRFHASAQRIHEVNDFRWRTLFRRFDLLASLLLLQRLLERILVLVSNFSGSKGKKVGVTESARPMAFPVSYDEHPTQGFEITAL